MAESSGKIVSNNANLHPENKPAERSESLEENKTEPVMEPMLLEDYREDAVPLSLENVFKYLKQKGIILDKHVTLAVFIYILMLETGFVPSEFLNSNGNNNFDFHYTRLLLLTNNMPHNWKKHNMYEFSFNLSPFLQEVCKITCISVCEDLVINASVKTVGEENLSLLLDPLMYIVHISADGTSRRFQNLRDLSQKFKNCISNPCKTLILQSYKVRPASLQGMPPEVFWNIVKYCDRESILNLDKTCDYFKELCVKVKTENWNNFKLKQNIRQYCTKYLFMR